MRIFVFMEWHSHDQKNIYLSLILTRRAPLLRCKYDYNASELSNRLIKYIASVSYIHKRCNVNSRFGICQD